MPRKKQENHELRGLTKEELLKLAKSKKLRVAESIKKEELVSKLDAVMKLGKLEKILHAKPKKTAAKKILSLQRGVPLSAKAKRTKKTSKPRKAIKVTIDLISPQKRQPLKLKLPIRSLRQKKAVAKKEEVLIRHPERRVGSSKYVGAPSLAKGELKMTSAQEELPTAYGSTRIALLARDPEWLHAYWEVTPQKLEEARHFFGSEWNQTRTILRVYDVTAIQFNGSNAHGCFDILLIGNACNWYIHTGQPDKSFVVDIARVSPSGRFFVLARSNAAHTPRNRMSDVIDEEWMCPDFARLYALSGGLGIRASSAEMRRMMEKGILFGLGSSTFAKTKKEEAVHA